MAVPFEDGRAVAARRSVRGHRTFRSGGREGRFTIRSNSSSPRCPTCGRWAGQWRRIRNTGTSTGSSASCRTNGCSQSSPPRHKHAQRRHCREAPLPTTMVLQVAWDPAKAHAAPGLTHFTPPRGQIGSPRAATTSSHALSFLGSSHFFRTKTCPPKSGNSSARTPLM